MLKKIAYLIFQILNLIDSLLSIILNKSFLIYFNDFVSNKSYKKITILDKQVKFFVPNHITRWRVDTFYSKEPETLEWIDSFENQKNTIFWDIGANIGLYSIYNALKNFKTTTFAFEPSTSNLRVLSRNICINNLEEKINILPIPLSNKENTFQLMKEGSFVEGGALNSFGENYDFEGKIFKSKMQYKVQGTSINYLIENNILKIPHYIKIDVDGIEHLILEGGSKVLDNDITKSISVEINENFEDQYHKSLKILKNLGFKIKHKKRNENFISHGVKFDKTYNYVFNK